MHRHLWIILLFAAGLSAGIAQPSLLRTPGPPVITSTNVPRDILLQETPQESGKKSVSTAVIYSLLLPGMGELYAGRYDIGRYFTVAEGAFWLVLGSVDWYANWLQDDARSFAAQHAGVVVSGKSDQYFTDIGNFQSVYAFNTQVLRDRDPHKLYDPNSSYYWNWDSPASMSAYRDRRVSSDQMFNNTRFVAAAIAVNHLVSALNAARLTAAFNKGEDGVGMIDLHADVLGGPLNPQGIMFTVSRNF